ncbi:MAG: class I SAM-dependent methyltransferase [Candidatus Nanoarchaeia archaeon]
MKEHYYSQEQHSKENPRVIKTQIFGNTIELETDAGVFSPKKVDKGSEVLILNAKINDGDRVLDLGCGYGAVGITLAKEYNIELVMTEVNKRAVRLARRNVKKNNVNAKILQGDGFEKVQGEFDTILLNPPQSAGKKLCENLIEQSKDFLKKGGKLQVVARKNKGGKVLSEFMQSVFGNLEVLAKSGGFWVYKSVK